MSNLTIEGAFHEVKLAYIKKYNDNLGKGAQVISIATHNVLHSEEGLFSVWKCKRWCKANFVDVIRVERP
jgi:hypothetical protein